MVRLFAWRWRNAYLKSRSFYVSLLFFLAMRVVRLWRAALALFLGFTFFSSGMAKLYAGHRFIGWIGPVWLAERLKPFQLDFFADFIAATQILTGFLLLTRRFWLLGAIMLVPMLVNILVITISQHWPGTPYIVTVLLLMNGALLLSEFRRLRVLWSDAAYTPPAVSPAQTIAGHLVWGIGLLLTLAAVPVSYRLLPLSYWLAGGGVMLAWSSGIVDTHASRRHPQTTLS